MTRLDELDLSLALSRRKQDSPWRATRVMDTVIAEIERGHARVGFALPEALGEPARA